MRKRNDWEIYLEILEKIVKMNSEEKQVLPTNIMHEVNMNWKSFNKYFKTLEQKKFIKKEKNGYRTTKKGEQLEKTLKTLQKQIK
ncbi:winged helix-turn-helix domain-containing protein [Methanonatronarchaeum sp. AMET6-2]|uniref:winged helix-turn-helix domain-containing protein n=1 Tax=Methanonatronarchaeum sp. AMET6-2 TaxID=2933293 RepID=UPI001FF686F1|nr:winged helix-turn-helix domain-containing protein [Methanonatronarchaeum sp. AMET6-2]UOY09389.1 winged helix-turn-helix domain-containing protein [Methanonatronarchaeum sp. AMET6-2]